MHFVTLLALVPACLAAAISSTETAADTDYGYWDVQFSRSWAANGYKGWSIAANYSGTPGVTKHASWMYAPATDPNGTTFRNTTTQDVDFEGTVIAGYNQVILNQTVTLSFGKVNITGSARIDCPMNMAGRGCSGGGRINATCVAGCA